MSARATGDRHCIEVRGLEEDVGRALPDLGVGAAHDTGDADDARTFAVGRVCDQEILRVEFAFFLVQGHQRLARTGAAHDDRGSQVAQIVGVHRLTEIEHDVVRDVDREGHRSHSGSLETLDHPARSRSVGVRAAHDASNETIHTDAPTNGCVIGEDHRETVGVRSRRLSCDHARQARVAEGSARRVRVLASDSTHGEAVAAVRGHVDLEDLFAKAKPGHDVRADGGNLTVREVLRQHDDAVVILAESEFARGADHAVGNVTIGLARGDLEVARQHGSRQRDDHQVVDVEVVRAADDAAARQLRGFLARAGGVVVLAHVHAAVVDGLAVRSGLLHARQDAAHDEGADDAGGVDFFFLKADLDQGGGQGLGVRPLRNVDVVGQPAQRNHRHVSFPFH